MIHSQHKRFFRLSLLMLCLQLFLQVTSGQKGTPIELLNADLIAYDPQIGEDARKLIGNVRLKHEDVIMTCDSAYLYPSIKSVDAFSNVWVQQGDTLTMKSDLAFYNGISKIARVRNNVELVNKDITLLTDSLNYDRGAGFVYYMGGGILTQKDSRLTSGRGRYILDTEDFYFMDSVVIVNPEYTIHTDSLRYNTRHEISYFSGPTVITGEERYIYCENGWYDMQQDISYVSDNAYMEEAGRILKGDTLYYEAEQGFGRAVSNVEMIDTAQNMTLKGNFGLYYSEQESVMVTDSALMIQIDGSDTMYVHADTLRTMQNPDKEEQSRILRAYYKVKIFRTDLQVMCDSLVYVEADSAFDFFGDPVIWSDENQLTASHIRIYMVNQQLEKIQMNGVAFVASKKDSVSFDQMRGKEMTGYFKENKLDRILVTGNGQTIYYATDQDIIVGANKTVSSNLTIYLNENKISSVVYTSQPDGTYYPLNMFPVEEARLSDFKWLEDWRPHTWEDIFIWK